MSDHQNCRCAAPEPIGTDTLIAHARKLPDAHLRAAIDGQLDALNLVRQGKRAWGTDDEIVAGLAVLAAELRDRPPLPAPTRTTTRWR